MENVAYRRHTASSAATVRNVSSIACQSAKPCYTDASCWAYS